MNAADVPNPTFDVGRSYLVTGRTLNAILRAIRRRTIAAGAGITLEETVDQGVIVSSTAQGGSTPAAAFYHIYTNAPDLVLQGGQVTAGEGSASMPDYMVWDDGGLPAGITAGDILWLDIEVMAILDDEAEIMISGLEITACTYNTGTTPPTNAWPGLTTAGRVVIELGRWWSGGFLPATAGHINIAGCNGNLDITRY